LRLGGSEQNPPMVRIAAAQAAPVAAAPPGSAAPQRSPVTLPGTAAAPQPGGAGAPRSAAVPAKFQKKGGSQVQFLRNMQMDKDPAGLRGASTIRRIPMEEVREHASIGDIWMVLQGRVFNVTPYMDYHPGGKAELMRSAGGDGTALYNEIHPWISLDMIEKLQVGLIGASRAASSTAPATPAAAAPSAAPTPKALAPSVALHPVEWRAFPLVNVRNINADCILMRFDIGAGRVSGLRPGQHLNARVQLRRGEGLLEVQRKYTPVSDVEAVGYVELLVKVYPSGKMGSVLAGLRPQSGDGPAAVGDSLEMQGPFGDLAYIGDGRFALGALASAGVGADAVGGRALAAGCVAMFAAGSGLTPMLQLLRPIMGEWRRGAGPQVTLVFCNRREEDIVYRQDLERLAGEFGGARLRLRLLLSQPPGGASETWPGGAEAGAQGADIRRTDGRISDDILAEAIAGSGNGALGAGLLALTCGPEGFDAAVVDGLSRFGVPADNLHVF